MPAGDPTRSKIQDDDFITIDAARQLVPCSGKRAPRERVLTLGLNGEIALKRFGNRWWVSRSSIDRYVQRFADQAAA